MAREIIHAGLVNHRFVDRATVGYAEYAAHVEPYTLAEGERITGVPAEMIRETAHAFARADRAMICWTLGITEHHVGVDNVLALINLALLCGHVGRWGSGLNPLRGQNNVQGGGDMGAIPNKLPGFQDIERDAEARARFEAAWGCTIVPRYGWNLTQMFEGMKRGELRSLYVIGENPAQSEADIKHTRELLAGLDFLVVQDILLTKTAELRRRRAALERVLVRGRGHGDQLRAPGAARAQGARPAGRGARRRLDHQRDRRAHGPRLGPADGRAGLDGAALALAHAPRHELREARGAGRHPVALPRRGEHRLALPARAPVGGAAAGRAGAVLVRRAQAALRGARRGVPDAPHDGPAARVLQHRRADQPLPLAAAPRRVARPLARGRRAHAAGGGRGRARVRRAAARSRRRSTSIRRCGPGWHS